MAADHAADDDPGPALAALWAAVAPRMADLPIYNQRLDVRATAFRRAGGWRIGVVTTPWFMNAVAVPDRPESLPPAGATVAVELPDGTMDTTVADLDGFGRIAVASLFSPMEAFDDPDVAFEVAAAALDQLLAPPPPPKPPVLERSLARPLDRRGLLFGRTAGEAP